MSAETLNCPMCGASARADSSRCEHCGARLATISCPSCFGRIFLGSKFCSHCGARADRRETAAGEQLCPRCRTTLNAVEVGGTTLQECSRCEGIWADKASLEQICAEREKQAAVLGTAATVVAKLELEKNIRYVPCPECGKLMHRVNFARCSQVIVDVCREHGTWFDRDELRRIVEFIRGGGLDVARDREKAELEERQQALKAAQSAVSTSGTGDAYSRTNLDLEMGISTAGAVLRALLK